VQKLWEYRNKLAYKAVCAVFSYFCSQIEDDTDMDDSASGALAAFAKSLLPEHSFVFKGMEDPHKVSQNFKLDTDAYSYALSVAEEKRHL
jgi:hypothetical protein